ncbi:ATP-binding protein [Hymenobacter profundi]|uniref:ATP-binding protein n=1 Tax=Hymenobacter profundi TaxID=1982110 RepID=A0ABS6WX09_9BACT|nr:ATP-binding protein [Hymenobacter profundi]MBW3127289.1 ATP-binding protein [Hymenobacter profundi]
MSTISFIEAKLLTLSPAAFQKLGDAYLSRFRGWRIQSWGAMVGADKDRTGVPDSHCLLPDSRFIFLAYTTADQGLPAKLAKDLTDCITRTQPTIQPQQVERICLVFNRRCAAETVAALHEQARVAHYRLELINVDDIVRYILEYPALAAELIGLDLGSGQLVHAPDFISIHQRQVGTTHFTETLFGRDAEQAELQAGLDNTDLVLVTGPAGVGKTQLVLTVAQAWCAAQPDQRQLYFVFDKKSPDFIRELQFALRPGQQVIVVADDANRVSPYFNALLAEQLTRPAGTLKIIATVRDYARDSVAKAAEKNPHTTLELKPLSDEAIQELVAAEPYCIRNGDYVQRIQQLSAGRPRLAIMSAQAAREAERIYRLHNIYDIYEGYFGPVLDDLTARQNPFLGQVLALIYFFRVVHQDHDEIARQIETAFGINPDQFWQAVQELHEAELVDLHEGRIVKTADQILGSFVFYRLFFSERPQLSYSQLLHHFFPQQQRRVVDTLNGCINDFGIDTIRPRIQKAVGEWLAQPDLSFENRWDLYHVFWPFLISQILTEAKSLLAAQPWPAFDVATYPVPERNNHSYFQENPLYVVLKDLCDHALDELPTALRLFIEFTAKHPDHFPKALEFLRSIAHFDGYKYRHQGLYVQETVVKVLTIGANSASHAAFYQWLIAHIVPPCLATVFNSIRPSYKPNTVSFANDELPQKGKRLEAWRDSLWQLLFRLYPTHSSLVLEGINTYLSQRHDGENSLKWRQWDADRLIPFFADNLDPASFAHCHLVNQYSNWLEGRIQHPQLKPLRRQFNSALFRLYNLLAYDQPYKKFSESRIDTIYDDEKRAAYIRIRTKLLQYKSFVAYARLIDQYQELYAKLPITSNGYPSEGEQLDNSFAELIHELFERDPSLAKKAIVYLLQTGNSTGAVPWKTIQALAQQHELEANYSLISQEEYRAKATWQLLFLKHLPADQVSVRWLQELMQVFQSGIVDFNFYNLTHFEDIAPTLYPDLLTIGLKIVEQNPSAYLCYGVIKSFGRFFSNEQQTLLERYYQWWNNRTNHYDWSCKELAILVNRRPGFLLEVFNSENYHERRPLTFLWEEERYSELLPELLAVLDQLPDWMPRSNFIKSLFPKEASAQQKEHMLHFITDTIRAKPDTKLTRQLFKAVRESQPEQLMHMLELIFQTYPDNPNQLFQHLSLFPSMRTSGGSWIPVHEADKEVWEQVIQTIDRQEPQTFELLDYRQCALRQIGYLNQQITDEAARNFADPY